MRISQLMEKWQLIFVFGDASWNVLLLVPFDRRAGHHAWCLTAQLLVVLVLHWPRHLVGWASPRCSCRSCVGALDVRLAHYSAVHCLCGRYCVCWCVGTCGGSPHQLRVEADVRAGMLESKAVSNECRESNAARNERQAKQQEHAP